MLSVDWKHKFQMSISVVFMTSIFQSELYTWKPYLSLHLYYVCVVHGCVILPQTKTCNSVYRNSNFLPPCQARSNYSGGSEIPACIVPLKQTPNTIGGVRLWACDYGWREKGAIGNGRKLLYVLYVLIFPRSSSQHATTIHDWVITTLLLAEQ